MYNKISATLSYDHVLGNYTILKQSDNDLFRERLSEKSARDNPERHCGWF